MDYSQTFTSDIFSPGTQNSTGGLHKAFCQAIFEKVVYVEISSGLELTSKVL